MNKLQTILACPLCKGDLGPTQSGLLCKNCQRDFQFREKIPTFLMKEKLDHQKQKELLTFDDLEAYQELMSKPYFRYLKDKISDVLRSYSFKNKSILEIGAGKSLFLDIFKKYNFIVVSDINFSLLKQNKNEYNLVVADTEYLPFKDNSFDFVYLVGVLHHLKDQKKALEEIKRIIKKDGLVFISEPTKYSINFVYYLIRQLFLKILGEARLKRWIGCGTPYESFVSMSDIYEVLGEGFDLKFSKILPFRLPPIKILERLSLTKINNFAEKTPLIKNLGTIVFIEAKKRNLK